MILTNQSTVSGRIWTNESAPRTETEEEEGGEDRGGGGTESHPRTELRLSLSSTQATATGEMSKISLSV